MLLYIVQFTFFAPLIYYLRTFSFYFSLPTRHSDPGSLSRLFSPPPPSPPRYKHAFDFHREKTSALANFVDSDQISP